MAVAAAAVALASPDLLYTGYVTADALGYLLALIGAVRRRRHAGSGRPFAARRCSSGSPGSRPSRGSSTWLSSWPPPWEPSPSSVAGIGRVVRRHWLIVATPILGGARGRPRRGPRPLRERDVVRRLGRDPPLDSRLCRPAGGRGGSDHRAGGGRVDGIPARPPGRPAATAFASIGGDLDDCARPRLGALRERDGLDSLLRAVPDDGHPARGRLLLLLDAGGTSVARPRLGVVAVLGVAFVRVPVSEYAAGMGRADSPFLLGVSRLEA